MTGEIEDHMANLIVAQLLFLCLLYTSRKSKNQGKKQMEKKENEKGLGRSDVYPKNWTHINLSLIHI